MKRLLVLGALAAGLTAAAALSDSALGQAKPTGRTSAAAKPAYPAYPIELRADAVFTLPKLDVTFSRIRIQAGPCAIVPIKSEVGVMGAVVLGQGRFTYTRRNGAKLGDDFRAAVLRFHPHDYEALLPVAGSVAENDLGALALAQAVMRSVFGRCYARGELAQTVDRGALAATFYSKATGDVLIVDNGRADAAYSFTAGRLLFGQMLPEMNVPGAK